jgi:hypothetical protein
MKKAIFASFIFLFAACNSGTDQAEKDGYTETKVSAAKSYACPMHCEGEKTYIKAGKCPVCKMDLQEIAMAGTDSTDHNH